MHSESNSQKFHFKYKLEILWSVAVILIAYFLFFSIKYSLTPSNGFASYFTASRLIIEGEIPSDFYNDDYFSSKVKNYVPGIYEIYSVNMPITAFMVLPLAFFGHDTARILWNILSLVLLAFTIFFTLKKMQFNQTWLPFTLILIFSFQPLYSNMMQAQAYILVLSLLSIVFFVYKSNKDNLTGLFMGIVLLAKSAGNILLILFAIQKRWNSLLWVFTYLLLIFLITLPILGVNSWLAYLDKLLNYSSDASLSVTAHQSIYSFCYHLFSYNAKWNPHPILNQEIIAKVLTMFFSFLVLVVTVYYVIKYKKVELAFGSFIIISLILNPATMDYHYVIILIPIFILIEWLRGKGTSLFWGLFISSFLLIALNLPYVSPKLSGGWVALFAYPKLYGAVGLWSISLIALRNTRTENSKLSS
jgi:hypothetical protein